MTDIDNDTPFPHFCFSNTDNQGREFGVLMVKIAFDIGGDGRCTISDDQEPFSFTDQCHGAVNVSALRLPSDLVSYKPRADIILDSVAYAPEGRPSRSWSAGVRVMSRERLLAEKQLRVTGPRQWVPQWRKDPSPDPSREDKADRRRFEAWRLSEPEPALRVPIRYELAYGGTVEKADDEDGNRIVEAYESNPIGSGWLDATWSDHRLPRTAPQIEDPSEPITEPYRHYAPAGFGPIPPAWLPRRAFGGTFDQTWRETIWPKWPPDYDFALNNSAAAGLTIAAFPQGPLTVELENLRPDSPRFRIEIPDPSLILLVDEDGGGIATVRPNLDTVVLQVAAEDLFDCRVSCVWRMPFNLADTAAISVVIPNLRDPSDRARLATVESRPRHPDAFASPCALLEKQP